MTRKKTIALFTSSQGHFSLSEAIRENLEAEYNIVTFFEPVFLRNSYVVIYRFFPSLFSLPYHLGRFRPFSNSAKAMYTTRYNRQVSSFLDKHKPDFIITTYFFYLDLLKKYQQEQGLDFLNVVSNPYSILPLEISDAAAENIVFNDTAIEKVRDFNQKAPLIPWGWFVRDAYEKPYDQKKVRKQLNLNTEWFTLLLAGGSEGNQKILDLLPILLNHSKPLNIIVSCGSNVILKKAVDELVASHALNEKKVIVLGFSLELHTYLQAADLYVGKAGPNSLFEAVATHTPFFAISHIAGQEDGNLDLIKEYQIGVVEENTDRALELLTTYIEQPSLLEIFTKNTRQLAIFNRNSKTLLKNYLRTYFRTKN